eukprot:CAMPEP_0175916486 /NCGR_PEP_ID=MMETSP0108-20121206/10872_1 /TAXON_ID=195067 ORGANISM="Goniomonas pacifica, Strain CCMP1869" /NCGR_SAMPLE_ID=MMETSP0108 /ASSEMBLY_ACC=CAM_ASM_000204 /LENGTH=212 /DNA_ID=CAMNT_0017239041 /DNA_START=15 /DNA_END=653 /DNA_ORIENTATION=-
MFRLTILLALCVHVYGALPAPEVQALKDLYNSTGGPSWTHNTNWLKGDPCENKWFGVVCHPPAPQKLSPKFLSDGQDHVYELSLAQNNLVGTLEESFGNLEAMQWIALDIFNQLSGPMPQSVSKLTEVTLFTIAGSFGSSAGDKFSGPIPQGICNMKKLEVLHFGANRFTSVPACDVWCNIPNCDLGHNPLKGTIPQCAQTNCHATTANPVE